MSLPEDGIGLDATLDELAIAVEHGCRISSPGFLGFITTGATTVGVAAHAAVAAAGGQRYLLHSFNALEWTALRWLADLCGLPDGVAGVFTSGGSTANLIALGAARQAAYERLGIDVAEAGLPPAAPRGRIYATDRCTGRPQCSDSGEAACATSPAIAPGTSTPTPSRTPCGRTPPRGSFPSRWSRSRARPTPA
jgi:glutamate/tyrosine decarboxylase-like PLP-dependent enzyme